MSFAARVVAVVHENSDVPTTVGNNMKRLTDLWSGGALHAFSDDRLQAQYNDSDWQYRYRGCIAW